METMAFAGVGFLVPPFLESFVAPYLPAGITSNVVGKYAFKAGAVLGTTYLAKMVLGKNAARAVAVGGGVYILASAVMEFAPQLLAPGTPMRITQTAAPANGGVRSYVAGSNVRAYVPARAGMGASPFGSASPAARFKRY